MAAIRMSDVRKLSLLDAQKKLVELQNALLELSGEGKMEKTKPIRKAIARLKLYIEEQKKKANKPNA